MRINFKKVFISLVGVFLLSLFILMTVYLVNRKVNTGDGVPLTPDPTREFQKAENDKTITEIYRGKFPCQDCDAVEVSLALTKETKDENDGTYISTRAYLGTGRDVEYREGEWVIGEKDGDIILNPGESDEVRYIRTDEGKLVMVDNSDVVLELFK